MAALKPLEPPIKVALDQDHELIFIEAARSERGLLASVQVYNGDLKAGDVVALGSIKSRNEFAKKMLELLALPEERTRHALLNAQEAVETALRLEPSAPRRAAPPDDAPAYEEKGGFLWWNKPTANGPVATPLLNFTAHIVGDVAEDDGAEVKRLFEIEAQRNERTHRFFVSASAFDAMSWPAEHLGANATHFPGSAIKDHARFAIRSLSGEVPTQHVYTHLGWKQLPGGAYVYLHAGGAIGAEGAENVTVRLTGTLQRFELPSAPTGEELQESVAASLRLWDLAPDRLSIPLHAATFRAAIATADFSIHLAGQSGVFKSEEAALAQQHYGASMNANNLPASWSSTENALEGHTFLAKDALLTIDDFAPVGTSSDVQALHRKADRVLRAQGNNAGRQRMRSDGTLRPPRPPRGLILSTGEDVPTGVSLRARIFTLDANRGDIDKEKLTACQHDAAAGLYAQAMAAFLAWFAPQYAEVAAGLRADVERLRLKAVEADQHLRTPEILADLAIGMNLFLRFAHDVGVLTEADVVERRKRGWLALREAGRLQAGYQQASNPALRYLELVRAGIASGEAHVASLDGDHPTSTASTWGWRARTFGPPDDVHTEWLPQGKRIGWVDGEDLYLEPEAAFTCARRLGADSGDGLTVTSKTLNKRLWEAGLLLSREGQRGYTIRKRGIENKRPDVLHLSTASILCVEPDPSAPPDPQGENDLHLRRGDEPPGQKSGSGFSDAAQETDPKNCPNAAGSNLNEAGAGQVGQMGQVFTTDETPENGEDSPDDPYSPESEAKDLLTESAVLIAAARASRLRHLAPIRPEDGKGEIHNPQAAVLYAVSQLEKIAAGKGDANELPRLARDLAAIQAVFDAADKESRQ